MKNGARKRSRESILCYSHTETPGRIHSHFSTDADNNQGQANYNECHPHIITVIDPVHVQNRLTTGDRLKRHNEPISFQIFPFWWPPQRMQGSYLCHVFMSRGINNTAAVGRMWLF